MWSKEPNDHFLNEHHLYRAVHKGLWQHWKSLDRIDPVFFYSKNAQDGLSFDWSLYATPIDTLNRRKGNDLKENGIIQLRIGDFRECSYKFNLPLALEHSPTLDNRAHTLMHGVTKSNKTKIRRKLSKIAVWAEGMKPIK